MKYLKSFIVGSSLPVFFIFFRAVIKYKNENIINYSFDDYSIIAPLYFGLMTTIAMLISNKIGLQKSLFIISLISSLFVMILIKTKKLYKFQEDKFWYRQYFRIFIAHLVVYNIIIYIILKNIC